ncbi:hypothetical protein EPUS_03142 [Endocarpon pusillum Z07020]|uniref:Major facilitator superfamily (MFS) profile domain-containing protein n=1 Tax=Endocarpon pusillum (strain Z07020 / HMAS-L-300199) TaxID=1263415 RepID=U1HVC7_ENDPU|nr:uncharacterized protein EPUS_03142 [Endocarpon pusillum Z07020]ERF73309.1 hypothetical protein EPUS_03142 [Endocarpon pusillum Z07020]
MSTITARVSQSALSTSPERQSLSQRASTSTQREPEAPATSVVVPLPRWKATLVIVTIGLMTMMSTVLSGVLAVALPKIAKTLGIAESLLLWPASVYSLTCGCTLLLSGSLADVFGSRLVYLIGSAFSTSMVLACGLSRSNVQLIVFRALHGIAISLCLPSSVSMIAGTFQTGQRRNIAFACLGGAQPMGFLVGLVIGGILTDTIGWRPAFYILAGINAVVFCTALTCLPEKVGGARADVLHRFKTEIDWLGVVLISTSLGLLSYVLAAVTVHLSAISSPTNIALLILAVLLLPAFSIWVHHQEKAGRPALIPNSIWRNPVFTSLCITAFFAWATVTANQYFLALYYQKVQLLTAFDTSLRFLPLVVSGVLANIAAGSLVRRVRADVLIGGSVLLSAATPLIMALIDPSLSYWTAAFTATLLSPIWADITLIVANLVVTQIFPSSTHGLAGGVSNTMAQVGTSLGLNFTAILATGVTMSLADVDKTSPSALERGYRAAFWASFAATVLMLGVTGWGMGRMGKVGTEKTN